ncbi:MAG: GGDEF domain-containing protein [Candidatus Thiodiazotropha lotti]|uniref:diguanylate cyclase n=1 Tax=Candidatus Thiodiazotropha lotti TaxID=2792787 RepID=A0A9E4N1Q6_9GAMM|nr:GGDEF domain-containing protein [Candidatus Thiodiazotropha lotti]ODC00945.1 hypothetical protein A3197_00130 [Candidatus Thiodiazotropha endoloripes]MCG7929811.1 GGDEF domain-containing protein [Candidatus Thiodiazotropha lotti]MCG7940653.1 GGDEF domain-containing protein [Candidatus Thiodiazotropha lotti]MCG7989570.1 GGDEF domain-containing protein [Candidatus Thiodiazotropha lotti]
MPKFQQVIKRFLRVRSDVLNAYPISLSICLIGFLAHLSFIFLFDYWAIPSLSYFNIFSSLLWAWAIAEVVRGYVARSVYIGTAEVLLHAVIAMSILGLDSGFDLYLWPLAGWLAYNPNIKKMFALIAGSASIILWMWGRTYWGQAADVPIAAETLDMMLRLNTIIAGSAFIVGIIGARMHVDRQSEMLSAQADRDELTGLYNRRFVIEHISSYERGGRLDRRAYALIMTDIDLFKAVNDKFGHEIGDKALEVFSKALQRFFRKEDMVARWGGEEFIIVLPNCTLEEASAKAEAIRSAIADEPVARDRNQSVYLTASFGVTESLDGERFSDLLSRVDKLLYQAKESGRNCVVSG